MAFSFSFLSLFLAYPELILAFSFFLLFFFINKRYHAGRGLPIDWPLTGHIPYMFLHRDRFHDWCTDVLRRSGYTFLFKGPLGTSHDILLSCDPANVNHVFSVNFPNYPKGDGFAEIFDFLGNGIFNADEDSWKFQRRKAHSLMSSPRFRSFVAEASQAKVEKSLIPLLHHFASAEREDKILDLQDVFLRLSFDNTCLLVFGIDPGCLSIDFPAVPFATAMDVAEQVVFSRHTVPRLWWRVMKWMRIGPERRLAEAVETLHHFVEQFVTKRKEERRRSGDLLSSYLDSEQEVGMNGFKVFDEFLRDTTLNLMVAGRDTISSALTWFFYLLANNTRVETKILEEVKLHGLADLSKLVYLHAALCESLRLYPPVPFEHKEVLRPDVLPSGAEVHEKRIVLFSLYAMGRMEGIWGEDCMEFRPERWISAETGRFRREPSYKFFAFNAGPRTCLGKDMAFTQMKAVVAAVVGRFRIRVVKGYVARPKMSIILHMKGGLMVSVSKRED